MSPMLATFSLDNFAWPWLLLALPLPLLARLWLPPARSTAAALKVPYGERLATIAGNGGPARARGIGTLAWLAWGLLCVAAALAGVFVLALGFYITPALLGGLKDQMISQLIVQQVQKWAAQAKERVR